MSEMITKQYDVKDFNDLYIGGPGKVYLTQGDTESLSIEAPERIFDTLEVDNFGGKLSIHLRVSNLFQWLFGGGMLSPRDEITYRISVKDLKKVGFGGALDVEVTPLNVKNLELSNSGSVKARFDDITVDDTLDIANSGSVRAIFSNVSVKTLEMSTSGSGHVEMANLSADTLTAKASGSMKFSAESGTVNEQTVRISGSGTFNALQLQSSITNIHISGSGNAKVWVEGKLDVHVSGSGSVKYTGNATVNQRISGSGSIKKVNADEG